MGWVVQALSDRTSSSVAAAFLGCCGTSTKTALLTCARVLRPPSREVMPERPAVRDARSCLTWAELRAASARLAAAIGAAAETSEAGGGGARMGSGGEGRFFWDVHMRHFEGEGRWGS